MKLKFGYNTNGFAHHRLSDALAILGQLGYQSVGLTLDHCHLDPFSKNLNDELRAVRKQMDRFHLDGVVETGARFLLDPMRKHQPTLLSGTRRLRAIRIDFLKRSIDIARRLKLNTLSLWSGTPEEPSSFERLIGRLVSGCRELSEYAAERYVRLAFEPEPGMFIDTVDKFAYLYERVDCPNLGLTVDIGHLHCMNETPIERYLRFWKDIIWNVHIEDMKRGIHDHMMFGEGEIDFAPVLETLEQIGYHGGVYVELSRHSYNAVETAKKALAFLQGQSKAKVNLKERRRAEKMLGGEEIPS
ncbi:MAG TPA: sugar phosphate isomerase/epimerase family protein [Gemmataceae bacterium]|nr:sugar phosphate isomerase/epimerase family protein [Gemmataceae bacterium]